MKKIVLIALLAAGSAFAYACNGDDNNTDGGQDATPDNNVADTGKTDAGNNDSGFPAPPALKTQIDRMGRPAINTALNHPFDKADAGTAGPAKDSYNADKSVATWKGTYSGQFITNLAIFDGLDQNCGNQAAYGKVTTPSPYAALAGLAADDELYLDTSKTVCQQYLGVELNAVGILANSDCGGRTLPEDVMDLTYGAVSGVVSVTDAGVLQGLSDGVNAPAAKTNGTTFPYLAAPQ
jgi:hypothetical protein